MILNYLKYSIFLFCIFSISIPVIAQEEEYDYVLPDSLKKREKRASVRLPIKPKVNDDTYYIPSYTQEIEPQHDVINNRISDPQQNKTEKKKTSVNLELGSSVATDFKGNSAINTYIAPQVRHQLNEDFAVSGGLIVSQSYFNGWTNYSFDGSAQSMPSSLTSTLAHVRLDYKVNDRMLIYGAIYKNIATMPNGFGGQNQIDGYGYSVGMEYKISEKSFLQIQIQRSQGYNPFSNYPTSYGIGGRPFSYFP